MMFWVKNSLETGFLAHKTIGPDFSTIIMIEI
jgi:hypothetical protein